MSGREPSGRCRPDRHCRSPFNRALTIEVEVSSSTQRRPERAGIEFEVGAGGQSRCRPDRHCRPHFNRALTIEVEVSS